MASPDKVRSSRPRPAACACDPYHPNGRGGFPRRQENYGPPSMYQRAKALISPAKGPAAAPSPSTTPALEPEAPPAAQKLWHEEGKGFEIMERILKPLVGVFDDVMQELHDSRVPDIGREEEDAFMSKAVQYIKQYILSDRVTMR